MFISFYFIFMFEKQSKNVVEHESSIELRLKREKQETSIVKTSKTLTSNVKTSKTVTSNEEISKTFTSKVKKSKK